MRVGWGTHLCNHARRLPSGTRWKALDLDTAVHRKAPSANLPWVHSDWDQEVGEAAQASRFSWRLLVCPVWQEKVGRSWTRSKAWTGHFPWLVCCRRLSRSLQWNMLDLSHHVTAEPQVTVESALQQCPRRLAFPPAIEAVMGATRTCLHSPNAQVRAHGQCARRHASPRLSYAANWCHY